VVFFKQIRRLFYLIALTVFAFLEMGHSGLVRRTFEFFTYDGTTVVEDRMLHRASTPELNIKYYLEELILGPVSVDFSPLLSKETKLRSFMYRNNTVYADFSSDALMPFYGGQPLFDSMVTINQCIRRNFRSVSGVKLFIGGNEVFFSEFEKIFGPDLQK
jgi:hypothetical protein